MSKRLLASEADEYPNALTVVLIEKLQNRNSLLIRCFDQKKPK